MFSNVFGIYMSESVYKVHPDMFIQLPKIRAAALLVAPVSKTCALVAFGANILQLQMYKQLLRLFKHQRQMKNHIKAQGTVAHSLLDRAK